MTWSWLLPAITTLGGGALSAIGGANRSSTDLTQDWLDQFNQSMGYAPNNRDLNAGKSSTFWDMLTGGSLNPSNFMGQATQAGTQANNLLGKASQSANRSGTDIWNTFAQTQPGMMDWANQATNQAMSQNGTAMEDLARLKSSDAVRSIENMLASSGGAMGGAQYAALSRGASEPLLNAQAQFGQQRSNIFSNLYSPMAQAGYGQELNKTNELLAALQGAQNSVGTYGNIGTQLGSLMGQQAESQFLKPTLSENQNLLSLLGNSLMGLGFKGFGNLG